MRRSNALLMKKPLQTLITEATAKQLEAKAPGKLKEAEARLKSNVEETLEKKIDGQGSGLLNDLLTDDRSLRRTPRQMAKSPWPTRSSMAESRSI